MSNYFSKIKSNKIFKWSLVIMIIFSIFIISTLVANAYLGDSYKDKFLKNTTIGHVDIGGMTIEEAREKIEERLDVLYKRGFVYVSSNKTISIFPIVQSIESPDTSYPLLI